MTFFQLSADQSFAILSDANQKKVRSISFRGMAINSRVPELVYAVKQNRTVEELDLSCTLIFFYFNNLPSRNLEEILYI